MLQRLRLVQSASLPEHPTLRWDDGRPVRAIGRGRRGELIWPVHGGAPDDPDPKNDPPADDKKFTQADLDRFAAQRVEDTRRAERKSFYEANNIPAGTSYEDAVKLVKQREAEAEQTRLASLGETERLKEEKRLAEEKATRLEQEREAEREQSKAAQHETRVLALLATAGVGTQEEDLKKRDEIIARAARRLSVDVEVGADSDDIRKAIEVLRVESPGLFGRPGAGGGTGPNDGRPGANPPASRKTGESAADAGKALASKLGWAKDTAKAS